MKVLQTEAFDEWFKTLGATDQKRVTARINLIVNNGHFGFVKRFSGLTELKWKSGLRVYAVEKNPDVILLYGGNKNGQSKDIKKAKKILTKIE